MKNSVSFHAFAVLAGIAVLGSATSVQSQDGLRPSVVFAGSNQSGFKDAAGTNAQFSTLITGLDTDDAGNVYVADAGNLRVRKITPDGTVTTLAGTGALGTNDGPGLQAQFTSLQGGSSSVTPFWSLNSLGVDSQSNTYILDSDATQNDAGLLRIRRISASGVVSTFHTESDRVKQPTWTSAVPQAIWSISVDAADEPVLARRVVFDDPAYNGSIIAFSPTGDSRTVYDLSNEMYQTHPGAVSSRRSTNVFYTDNYHSNAFRVLVLPPSGGPKEMFDYDPLTVVGGFAAGRDNDVYLASETARQEGNIWRVRRMRVDASDSGNLENVIFETTTAISQLTLDNAGNIYIVQGSQILKLPNYKLTLATQTSGGGSISVQPPGVYASNDVVQVTEQPWPGWTFLGWSGDAQGTNSQIAVTMDRSKVINATFGAPLAVTSSGHGTVTIEPKADFYPYGTPITLTAQADNGFQLIQWSDGVKTNPRNLEVTNLIQLQAVFDLLLTLDAEALGGTGGTIQIAPSSEGYIRGDVVTLTAWPDPGHVFQTWLDNDRSNPRTVLMESNVTLFAVFASGEGKAPTVQSGPVDVTAALGDSVEFTVVAQGSTPITYLWSFKGTPIPLVTGPALSLTNVGPDQAGLYTVTVTNQWGSAPAVSATLNLITPQKSYKELILGDGPTAYWRLDENSGEVATDVAGGHNGTFMNGVLLSQPGALAGDTDTAAGFVAANQARIEVPYTAALNSAQFSAECWVLLSNVPTGWSVMLSSRDDSPQRGFIIEAGSGTWNFPMGMGNAGWGGFYGPAVHAGVWTYVALTYDGTTERAYINGLPVGSASFTYAPNTTQPLRIGAGGDATADLFFGGYLDEVAIYNKSLTSDQIRLHFLAGTRAPQIASVTTANGRIAFSIAGTAGQHYRIESSPDLHAWTQVTILSNTQGSISFDEAIGSGDRFYRVSVVP